MQYQPEQEEQEAAPAKKENFITQTLQGAGKVFQSVGSMFTNTCFRRDKPRIISLFTD